MKVSILSPCVSYTNIWKLAADFRWNNCKEVLRMPALIPHLMRLARRHQDMVHPLRLEHHRLPVLDGSGRPIVEHDDDVRILVGVHSAALAICVLEVRDPGHLVVHQNLLDPRAADFRVLAGCGSGLCGAGWLACQFRAGRGAGGASTDLYCLWKPLW